MSPFPRLTFTYDNAGRLAATATSSPGGQPAVTLTNTYNAANDRTNLADNLASAGSTTFAYDAADRLTTIAASYGGSPGPVVALGFDAANRLTSIARTIGGTGTAVTSALAYDAANRLTTLTHQVAGGSTLASYADAYDAANRVTAETNAEGTISYTYDADNQLTGTSGSSPATYSYDANGNRTMSGYATTTNNEMSSGAGYTYTYDHEANLVSKTQTSTGNVWTYAWDYRNRLTGVVEKNSSGSVLMQGTYTYDALNRRIGVDETVSGTETKTFSVYDGANVYADFNASGALQTRYLDGPAIDQILARTTAGGTTAWYLTDKQGSVRDIASSAGSVLDHVAYDSYGNVTSESTPTNGDRFKYDGMQFDLAINEYYDNARYYDAITGRFLNQDLSGFKAGDSNLYRYSGNNPSNEFDLTGFEKVRIRVGAYIPSQFPTVTDPYPWPLSGTYNGDDRGPGQPGSSRINIELVIDDIESLFTKDGQSNPPQPKIFCGTTQKTSLLFGLEATQATPTYRKPDWTFADNTAVVQILNVAASDPLCLMSPTIDLGIVAKFTKNTDGTITTSIEGNHDYFPAYDVTVYKGTQPGVCIYSYLPDPFPADAPVLNINSGPGMINLNTSKNFKASPYVMRP